MIYRFGNFDLDADRFEMSESGKQVALEPQVFQLLCLLVANRDRMVSKQEIVDHVWNGSAVSDASISSRIRSARIAIGDDGERQQFIRTVHGQGFRFVAPVIEIGHPAPHAVGGPGLQISHALPFAQTGNLPSGQTGTHTGNLAPSAPTAQSGKPGIAILPFVPMGLPEDLMVLGDAIPHEVIQALSRLRWISVIARGSTFRFRGESQDLAAISEILKVRYLLSGMIEGSGETITLSLELADARAGDVIWADRLVAKLDNLTELRSRIVAHVIAALEVYIPQNEAHDALSVPYDRLDAWANYHLGLQQMFHFTKGGNAKAAGLFSRAIELDPRFARAHAGLSFTRFQDAFLGYDRQRDLVAIEARRHAERALELDLLDPFANFTMGRSFWLTGDLDVAAVWLDRATLLNPNYAQGFYARAFTNMLSGNGAETQNGIDAAISLSPIDPLLYGMLGTRSLSLIQDGDYEIAAELGDKAANSPGAHYLISMIALAGNTLAGRDAQAQRWLNDIKTRRPDASVDQFLAAFPFKNEAVRSLMREIFALHSI